MTSKDTIKSLSVREQCRDKLSVFYGSRDNFYHGAIETIMNGSDEINNNFDKGVMSVTLNEDNQTLTIQDTGRGIPIHLVTNGVPNYVLLFETLFAGTNYDNKENGKVSTGTNGCGATVLANTCSYYCVESYIQGKKYTITYIDGGIRQGELTIDKCDKELHGTKITFKLDREVYTETTFDKSIIQDILCKLSGVSNKLTINFIQNEEEVSYHYDSFGEYMKDNAVNFIGEWLSFDSKLYLEENGEKNTVEAHISLSSEPTQQTFLNYTYLKEGGTIFDGVVDGLLRFFKKTWKSKTKLSNLDVGMAFNIGCSVLSTNVEFSNQTKFSTNKQLYKRIVSSYIYDNMAIVAIEKPKLFAEMIRHLETINNFNTKNEANIKNIKKKLSEKVDGIGNRVEGLVDCKIHGVEAELFICEGKSAQTSCVLSRNSLTQACMAIRGKILSTLKASYDTIFKSQVIIDLIKILGCGIEVKSTKNKSLETFNIENLRYHKIIITCDGDPDGAQIVCLVLTVIYTLIPSLIEHGHVYVAKPPLFEIYLDDGTTIYAQNEAEKDKIINKLKGKYELKRNKGLTTN